MRHKKHRLSAHKIAFEALVDDPFRSAKRSLILPSHPKSLIMGRTPSATKVAVSAPHGIPKEVRQGLLSVAV